jgi:unsaturated pyranuronate lyase
LTEVFRGIAELAPIELGDGLVARAVQGDRMTFAVIDLQPGAVLPEHQHENEQIGLMVQGEMELRVGSETRLLRPGDTYVIPSNVPHTARAGAQGASVVDVFTPLRADWEARPRREPTKPDWP